jgi:hypothetical protein
MNRYHLFDLTISYLFVSIFVENNLPFNGMAKQIDAHLKWSAGTCEALADTYARVKTKGGLVFESIGRDAVVASASRASLNDLLKCRDIELALFDLGHQPNPASSVQGSSRNPSKEYVIANLSLLSDCPKAEWNNKITAALSS